MNTQKIQVILTTLTIALLIVSCQGEQPTPIKPDELTIATSEPDIVSDEQPSEKTNMVAAIKGDPPGLDPVSTYASGYNIVPAMYSTLLDHEVDLEKGVYQYEKPICDLCESYEISADNKTITFKIKEGVTFSNGSALTADDIRWSFERTWNAPGYGKNQLQAGAINDIGQIKVVDDYTLEITYPNGMNRFSIPDLAVPIVSILDKETVEANATENDIWATEWVSRNAVGTGPYILKEWVSGDQIVLEARGDYHGEPKPRIDTITLRIIPDEQTQLMLLQSGEIDAAFGLSPEKLKELENDSSISLFSVPKAQDILVWRMNPSTPPFDDVHLRRAIAHSIPYKDIIEQTMYGFAIQADDICAPGTPAYESQDIYEYDLDAAKAELALSKYTDGTSFSITVPSENQAWIDALIWIQAELSKLGIDMDIQKLPSAAYQDKAIKREFEYDVNLHATGPWFDDCMYWAFWVYTSESSSNYTDLNVPEVDEAVNAALGELDLDEYRSLVDQVRSKLVDETMTIPLYISNYSVAHKVDLEGFIYWPWPGIQWEYLTFR